MEQHRKLKILSLFNCINVIWYNTLSNPSCFLTLLYTIDLAKPKHNGVDLPCYSAKVPYLPIPLAQLPIERAKNPLLKAIAFIFSSIFSQTLGTLKKKVGLISLKVSINLPYRASGVAKKILAPAYIVPIKSIIYDATWLNGKYEINLSVVSILYLLIVTYAGQV